MIVYAWLFAIKGYAVLAYDKRGVGAFDEEPHEWRKFNFVDLAEDSAAAYDYLQSQPRTDPQKDAVSEASKLIQADHEVTRTGVGYEQYLELSNAHESRGWFKGVYGDELPETEGSPHREWGKTILDFDPLPLLMEVESPTLWLFGDPKLDRFSPVTLSIERLTAAKAA